MNDALLFACFAHNIPGRQIIQPVAENVLEQWIRLKPQTAVILNGTLKMEIKVLHERRDSMMKG